MDHYAIWVDLLPGVDDLSFVRAVTAYLDAFRRSGECEGYTIRRRKFGFGPDGLGEFAITISFRDLAQLDAAFFRAATRSGETEALHAAVYSKVCNFRSALYRDFPDSVREVGD